MTKSIYAERSKEIQLGYVGENNALDVVFDISDMIKYYGPGTCQLVYQRNGDSSGYPCELVQSGNTVIWRIKNTDVACAGRGKCELHYIVGNTVAKSEIFDTYVTAAIENSGEVPEPWTDWMDSILSAAEEIKSTVTPAFSMNTNGHLFVTVGAESHDLGNIQGPQGIEGPAGPQGIQGLPGEKGNTGEQGIQGEKGEKGDTGAQGPQGSQGIQGPKGDKGDKGDTGETGPQGPQGPAGSGSGDMLASTYDPQGKEQDIFQYADDAAAAIEVPTTLAELTGDATHRTVTDAEKTSWNGKQPQHSTQTVTLTVTGWSNNQQTVSVTGVTASNTVMVSPAPASVSAYGDAGIYCSAQASGALTFTCASVPTVALSVNVAIFD